MKAKEGPRKLRKKEANPLIDGIRDTKTNAEGRKLETKRKTGKTLETKRKRRRQTPNEGKRDTQNRCRRRQNSGSGLVRGGMCTQGPGRTRGYTSAGPIIESWRRWRYSKGNTINN